MREMPRHLDREKIVRYAKEADTLHEFSRKARVRRKPAKRLLKEYGMKDEVTIVTAASLKS